MDETIMTMIPRRIRNTELSVYFPVRKFRKRLYWEVTTQPVMNRTMPDNPVKLVRASRKTRHVSSVTLSTTLTSIEDFFDLADVIFLLEC